MINSSNSVLDDDQCWSSRLLNIKFEDQGTVMVKFTVMGLLCGGLEILLKYTLEDQTTSFNKVF